MAVRVIVFLCAQAHVCTHASMHMPTCVPDTSMSVWAHLPPPRISVPGLLSPVCS